MMRLALLITLACMCACLQRPQNEVVDGPPHELLATRITNKALISKGLAPSIPDVTWLAGDCIESRDVPDCTNGVQFDPCEIYLLDETSTWAESEFAHEMIHCAIGDTHHTWVGWSPMVKIIRVELRKRGI